MRDQIRRNMPLFPMRIVTKLTELTPRQIRYYEQQGLISPSRTSGNQRLFSFNDVDRLLEIKSLMEKGVNIAGVKEVLLKSQQVLEAKKEVEKVKQEMSEQELRRMLKQQLIIPSRPGQTHLIHGELSRFFRH
ncbi:MerR family transcriptional regulator [Thermoflavimicrobium dichotomicum]|uniref:MerR family transcriptional regulator, glutamine synthetase repressor n=1 Tax=Thermoflavimicrobium dichotomicum TaxID=46223 RepID=A0A1I3RZF6_9BACL|nr:MerR family transcriptional regulator [Thermoflavimicrobium dichotomicum]SFJ50667.1 MerR family transcriptional regulator, glutamine synthetase repressor [Thermoflavimicrobium dichotomicum]